LFYNHHNHEGKVTIIPSTMETHQGDFWGKALLTLAYFRALCFIINYLLSCLFPSITNDIHIIGPLSIISFAYEYSQTKLCAIGFFIQLHKCVTWLPFRLLFNFNTPSQFTTPSKGIRVLGVPMAFNHSHHLLSKTHFKRMINIWTFSIKWVMFK
jgi:hypothetical protein